MEFKTMIKRRDLLSYLQEANIKTPTEIQRESIPLLLDKKNVLALAPTGTGKTLAFALSLFSNLKKAEEEELLPEMKPAAPLGIVLGPTRELAKQIHSVFKDISHHSKLRVRLLAGGESFEKEKALFRDTYDVLICAPGKLAKLLLAEKISLENTRHIIFDEADQLLDLGFKKDVELILKKTSKEAQIVLFSATSQEKYEEFLKSLFSKIHFTRLELKGSNAISVNVETYNVFLREDEKKEMLITFLKKKAKGDGLIFVNKKEESEEVFHFLKKEYQEINFHLLHGAMDIKERKKSYELFLKKGGVLVCTDIVARGLDHKNLSWVLNYNLPFEAIYYIHRSGRTGRGGKMGVIFNFVTPKDEEVIKRINDAIKNQTALKLKSIPFVKKTFSTDPIEEKIKKHKAKRMIVKASPRRERMKKIRRRR